jgi:uncharacterized protein
MAGKNPIGWFEIHVNDFDEARKFYGGVFEWEFKLSQGSKSLYWNIYTGENAVGGGFMKKSKPEHDGQAVILYIEVDDIDGILKKVAELGGKTDTPKTLISETAGYFSLFKDPDNNLIGLWSKK